MKKIIALALAASAFAFATTAQANNESSATQDIYVNVMSNLAVEAVSAAPVIDTMGAVENTFTFGVVSNCEGLKFSACATPLYKGGVNNSEYFLALGETVSFACPTANPFHGYSATVPFIDAPVAVNGLTGKASECTAFESDKPGGFDDMVSMTVEWEAGDVQLPKGQYQGKVKLVAMILAQDS